MNNFLENFPFPLEDWEENTLIARTDNSEDFAKMFNYVQNSDFEEAESVTRETYAYFEYTDGEYEIRLVADFAKDEYACMIGER